VRWDHPERGFLSPDAFIPLAENTGLIRPLTLYILDRALAQCRTWSDDGLVLGMAVNVSTRNLLDLTLPDEVDTLLQLHGVPAAQLELEITETTIMADPPRAKAVLARLSAMGVDLAVDDFGTGYTSLAWLRDLPLNTLKIDKSFVINMAAGGGDAVIVRSTVQLGRSLGLRVVAEGVEDAGSLDELRALGCDLAQGYHLSRPQPEELLTPWLRTAASTSATGGLSAEFSA
jgi:EAL domain-containing protein (putative c-di-GMP-specific phosphodiesterase class I)